MHNRYIFRFWGYVHRADNGCWLWLGAADAAGRGVYSVRTDGRAKTLKAKRTEADVRQARALVAAGSSIAAAARELGKPTQAIYLAVKGLTWRHVV